VSSLPTAPVTIVAGTPPTAAGLNTYRDNLNYLLAPPMGEVYQATLQSIPDVTETALTWDAETLDTDGAHSLVSNTSRITPTTPGWYEVWGMVALASGTGYRMTKLWRNGTAYRTGSRLNAASGTETDGLVHALIYCNGTSDYFELVEYQNSGGAINTYVAVADEASYLSWIWRSK